MNMTRQDWLDYLYNYKNPLDNMFRWEINTLFRKNIITEQDRNSLLGINKFSMFQLRRCLRNGITLDGARVGNWGLRQAQRLNERSHMSYQKKY